MGLFERLKVWSLVERIINTSFFEGVQRLFRPLLEKGVRPVAAGKQEGPPPFTPWRGEISKARVCLITTTGVHLADQEPFDTAAALGDPSFRVIPRDVDVGSLRIAHTHFSHRRAEEDINVIFPLERLREMAEEGIIGSVAPRHFSFGFDLHVKELVDPVKGTAHKVASVLREDGVDVALFIPG